MNMIATSSARDAGSRHEHGLAVPHSHTPAASAPARSHGFRPARVRWLLLGMLSPLLLAAGCASAPRATTLPAAAREPEPQTLRAGDVVKIAFPRAQTLDTTQQVRRDGKINLYLVGEVDAVNLTPADLEKRLVDLYASQLVSKEVKVTVVSSAFAVFVTGAVVRPGKLTPERSLTAFEAIMEAGGFDTTKANTRAVTVIRHEDGHTKNYTLDLKSVLEGKPSEPFYLKAYDTVYVPERVSWF
jgi:polysaccharide biosynthesis/export protein